MKKHAIALLAGMGCLCLAATVTAAPPQPVITPVCVDGYEYVVAYTRQGITIVQAHERVFWKGVLVSLPKRCCIAPPGLDCIIQGEDTE